MENGALVNAQGEFILRDGGYVLDFGYGYINIYHPDGRMLCQFDIDDIPKADAVLVVHGQWIGQRCSVCNESYMDYADADSYPAIGEPKPNYCPNCGADMRGEK